MRDYDNDNDNEDYENNFSIFFVKYNTIKYTYTQYDI